MFRWSLPCAFMVLLQMLCPALSSRKNHAQAAQELALHDLATTEENADEVLRPRKKRAQVALHDHAIAKESDEEMLAKLCPKVVLAKGSTYGSPMVRTNSFGCALRSDTRSDWEAIDGVDPELLDRLLAKYEKGLSISGHCTSMCNDICAGKTLEDCKKNIAAQIEKGQYSEQWNALSQQKQVDVVEGRLPIITFSFTKYLEDSPSTSGQPLGDLFQSSLSPEETFTVQEMVISQCKEKGDTQCDPRESDSE